MKKIKDFWNNKWEKKSVIYQGRALRGHSDRIDVDVKTFITTNDDVLKQVIDIYDLKKSTFNETAHACQSFVTNYLTYKDDIENSNCPEFWQMPFESLASSVGDCEDGAILMASLMINAGIPNWRVKVAAGTVKPQPTAPLGGHAWCLFLADREDGTLAWEIHDWCYYQDTEIPTGSKPLAKDGGYNNTYKDIWFTFNNEYGWSNKEVVVGKRVKS
ncbi:transglutaminase domain-containing protein [Clostridium perfringens]